MKPLEASLSRLFELEITTVLGCPVACSYCPQGQLAKAKKGRKNLLALDDFKKAIDNIDMEIGLAWTGYSEPCLCPDLGEMLEYTKTNKKIIQQITSTTLTGRKESIEKMITFDGWTTLSLHLPDTDKLMRGINVDTNYAELLEYTLFYRLRILKQQKNTRIICFGDKLHPDLEKVINKYCNQGLLDRKFVKVRGEVSTRSGGLKTKDLKNVLDFVDTPEIDKKNENQTFYYCNKEKLNQPCLLPDGDMNICSFDYGLRNTYGNLFENKLSTVFINWIKENQKTYLEGKLSPCTQCEHYVPYKK